MQYLEVPNVIGMLKITHVASGSFYLVQSINIRDAAIMANGQLKLGSYQSEPLQELYGLDPELDYTYIETENIEGARKEKHRIMTTYFKHEHLLNQQDYPKIPGVWSLTHTTGVVYWGCTEDIAKQHRHQYVLLNNDKHKSPRLQELYNQDKTSLAFAFEVCPDMEQARGIVKRRMDEAALEGLSANKGLGERQHQGPGVYILTFPGGEFYIGSSQVVAGRLSWHKCVLKSGTHSNPVMQKIYNKGATAYTVQVDPYPTKEEALEAEQILLDKFISNDMCINLADDVNGPASYAWSNPEHRKTFVAAIRKQRNKPESKLKHGKAMKQYWSDPEAIAKRSGGNNPFAKKISVDGVEYGSFTTAVAETEFTVSILTKRLKALDDTGVFYL